MTHIKKVMLSLIVTLVVLFGGYQGYQYWSIEKPINDLISVQKGVSIAALNRSPGDVQLQLQITSSYPFVTQFPEIVKKINEKLGNNTWDITFSNKATPTIRQAWQEMHFGVKEGIDTKHFSLVQKSVSQVAKKYDLLYGLSMDDQYVYLMLQDGNQTWYQVLPIRQVKA